MDLAYTVIEGKVICSKIGNVEISLLSKVNEGKKLHLSLIDPAKKKHINLSLEEKIKLLCKYRTDVVLVGGTLGVTPEEITEVYTIKENNNLDVPVIIFPSSISDLSGRADAILYTTGMNSRKIQYLIDEQVRAAPIIKKQNLEAIPVTYLVIEPGEGVGFAGDFQLFKRDMPEFVASYALAAQIKGSRWAYVESGSGANPPIHKQGGPKVISTVSDAINIPLLVGGGLRTPESVRIVIEAGANGVVTGNIIEEVMEKDPTLIKDMIEAVHES